MVYACHHETGTGLLNPIRELGAVAHRHGCVFIVDTTSSYAMLPIHMEEDNLDFIMASAQKGLMAMTRAELCHWPHGDPGGLPPLSHPELLHQPVHAICLPEG